MHERTVKERVRAVLSDQERSQAWLARKINMNETLLSHYMAGRRPLPRTLIPRMAQVLGVAESVLLGDESVPAA